MRKTPDPLPYPSHALGPSPGAPVRWAAPTRRFPWLIVGLAVALVLCGWLAIARCEELAAGSGRFVRLQMAWSVVAALAAVAAATPNYRILCRWSYAAFALAVGLLVVVYFFPPVNGARRWIRLGPVGFQPSELAKIATVLALARYLMYRDNYRSPAGLWAPLGLTLLPVVLVLREPDLGTAAVFLPVMLVMLFVAGARRVDLGVIVLAGLLASPLVWSGMSLEQKSRVTSLLEQAGPGQPAAGDAYHLRQAKQALALGGVWGSAVTGPTVDDPAAYHLPEARSDFIFCVLGERFGLVGIAAMLGLFALLIGQGAAVAAATREPFGRLVAVGLTTLVGAEVLVNTGMTVGLLPITGLSLPLVSYGGSGLVAKGLVIGLLVNIALRPGYEVAKEPFRYAVE
jgi:cell division protein FtsW (lipid II flippase)